MLVCVIYAVVIALGDVGYSLLQVSINGSIITSSLGSASRVSDPSADTVNDVTVDREAKVESEHGWVLVTVMVKSAIIRVTVSVVVVIA